MKIYVAVGCGSAKWRSFFHASPNVGNDTLV